MRYSLVCNTEMEDGKLSISCLNLVKLANEIGAFPSEFFDYGFGFIECGELLGSNLT
jgi:hypothetical protein